MTKSVPGVERFGTSDMRVINIQETGWKITQCMKLCNMTRKDIQELCGLGHVQAVYKWTNGENIPSIDHLVILADAFGVAIDDLLVTEKYGEEYEREIAERTGRN